MILEHPKYIQFRIKSQNNINQNLFISNNTVNQTQSQLKQW